MVTEALDFDHFIVFSAGHSQNSWIELENFFFFFFEFFMTGGLLVLVDFGHFFFFNEMATEALDFDHVIVFLSRTLAEWLD